ncbi:MAG: hypothetical protein M1336_07570 [Deltaproteobacteria bacterium]|nr:hypothetical protein [Deltaproteobacteria bacterium]
MLTWRVAVLFVHLMAVIAGLGGSLFNVFILSPVLRGELEASQRLKVVRPLIRRSGFLVLGALAVLVATGIVNVILLGRLTVLLVLKLVLVAAALAVAHYQYGILGRRFLALSADGPGPEVAALERGMRRMAMALGGLMIMIVYLALGITRAAGFWAAAVHL